MSLDFVVGAVGETIAAGTVIGGLEMLNEQASGKKRRAAPSRGKYPDPFEVPRSYRKRSRRRR